MADDLSADEIRTLLKLEPNATCGYVRETYLSKLSIAPGGLPAPFADGRPLGSALYFMMSPAAPVKLHRIKNHQLYHHYLGDPIEVLMLHDDGTHTLAVVGSDLRAGQRVQIFIPLSTPHASSESAAGSSAQAPSGLVSSPPKTSSSATPRRWQRATRTSPPRSAVSPCLRVSSLQFMLPPSFLAPRSG
jgi:predicted cupin superfamily sugar epimerase